jgi:hypothetical protein
MTHSTDIHLTTTHTSRFRLPRLHLPRARLDLDLTPLLSLLGEALLASLGVRVGSGQTKADSYVDAELEGRDPNW